MKANTLIFIVTITLAILITKEAKALTVQQFVNICQQGEIECHKQPILQSYVGGALDMIAVLQESNALLTKVYCKKPKVLFGVRQIINFILNNSDTDKSKNTMLLVVRYLTKQGACPHS